jgi:hypothetical protein
MISLMQRATSNPTSLSLCRSKAGSTSASEHAFIAKIVLDGGDCSTSSRMVAAFWEKHKCIDVRKEKDSTSRNRPLHTPTKDLEQAVSAHQ